jgi:DNA polymerase III alpha subunit
MTVSIAGILITGKEVRTRKKKHMGFFSFEDPHGVFETVLFPDRYKELLRLMEHGRAFVVRGKIEMEFETPIIEVHDLYPLSGVKCRISAFGGYENHSDRPMSPHRPMSPYRPISPHSGIAEEVS